MSELQKHETCPGCGSKMEEYYFDGTPEEESWTECPNPNCGWFED